MPNTYTPEQIERAKQEAQLLVDIYNGTGGQMFFCTNDGKKHDIGAIVGTIIAALEAAQTERDDWHRRYDDMLKAKWEAGELAELNRLERCHAEKERDAEKANKEIWTTEATMANYRILDFAAYAAKLEKAGDGMQKGINTPIPSGVNPPPPPEGFENWSDEKRDEWIMGQARATYIARCKDAENQEKCHKAAQDWDAARKEKP